MREECLCGCESVRSHQNAQYFRDRGATLSLGENISDSIWGGRWGAKLFFLLILYNFKNIWGGGGTCPPCPPTPRSLYLELESSAHNSFYTQKATLSVIFSVMPPPMKEYSTSKPLQQVRSRRLEHESCMKN